MLQAEERLTVLRKGDYLEKLGRTGGVKVRFFKLSEDEHSLEYLGRNGLVSIPLECMQEFVFGRKTDRFVQYDKKIKSSELARISSISFSVIYEHPGNRSIRTLDLTCQGNAEQHIDPQQQVQSWFQGLKDAVKHSHMLMLGTSCPNKRSSSVPPKTSHRLPLPVSMALPPVLLIPSPEQRETSGSCQESPFTAANVSHAPSVAGSHLGSNLPSTMCSTALGGLNSSTQFTNLQRTNIRSEVGDAIFFGRALADPPCGGYPSLGSGGLSNWHPLPASSRMDAAEAAVGGKQVAIITRGGDVYSWGTTPDGDTNEVPQKVEGLEGVRCKQVACMQSAALVLTDRGTMLTWGCGSTGVLGHGCAQAVHTPKTIRSFMLIGGTNLPFVDVCIRQISAGPSHCAAVSTGMQLYTWGDGVHGRLGHGDMERCAEPRQVQAFAEKRVTLVACGYYHTAAICTDPHSALSIRQSMSHGSGSVESALTAENDLSFLDDDKETTHRRVVYTWGGVFETHTQLAGCGESPAGTPSASGAPSVPESYDERHSVVKLGGSHQGCLGHEDLGKSDGLLLPRRINLNDVIGISCGENFTVAVTTAGHVYQMGSQGLEPHDRTPWEGAAVPTRVTGALKHAHVTSVSCGRAHSLAIAQSTSLGHLPGGKMPTTTQLFSWGCNNNFQLGRHTPEPEHRGVDPRAVPALLPVVGRLVFAAAAGSSTSVLVMQHIGSSTSSSRTPTTRPHSTRRSQIRSMLPIRKDSVRPPSATPPRRLPTGRSMSRSIQSALPSNSHAKQGNTAIHQASSFTTEDSGPIPSGEVLRRLSDSHMRGRSIAASRPDRAGVINIGSMVYPRVPRSSSTDVIPRMHTAQRSLPDGGYDFTKLRNVYRHEKGLIPSSPRSTANNKDKMERILETKNLQIADLKAVLQSQVQLLQKRAHGLRDSAEWGVSALDRDCSQDLPSPMGSATLDISRHSSGYRPIMDSQYGRAHVTDDPSHNSDSSLINYDTGLPSDSISAVGTFRHLHPRHGLPPTSPPTITIADQSCLAQLKQANQDLVEERQRRETSEALVLQLQEQLKMQQAAHQQQRQAHSQQLHQLRQNGSAATNSKAATTKSTADRTVDLSRIGREPSLKEAFWVPVDRGVHVRVAVHEFATVQKIKFSSKLFKRDGVAAEAWIKARGNPAYLHAAFQGAASNSTSGGQPEADKACAGNGVENGATGFHMPASTGLAVGATTWDFPAPRPGLESIEGDASHGIGNDEAEASLSGPWAGAGDEPMKQGMDAQPVGEASMVGSDVCLGYSSPSDVHADTFSFPGTRIESGASYYGTNEGLRTHSKYMRDNIAFSHDSDTATTACLSSDFSSCVHDSGSVGAGYNLGTMGSVTLSGQSDRYVGSPGRGTRGRDISPGVAARGALLS